MSCERPAAMNVDLRTRKDEGEYDAPVTPERLVFLQKVVGRTTYIASVAEPSAMATTHKVMEEAYGSHCLYREQQGDILDCQRCPRLTSQIRDTWTPQWVPQH